MATESQKAGTIPYSCLNPIQSWPWLAVWVAVMADCDIHVLRKLEIQD